MFINFKNFIYSSADNFPKDECVIQNERESDVFESDRFYQVLYINLKWPNDRFLDIARPYIFYDENGDISFGWIAMHSSEVFGNVENTCQFYDEFVVGFIPVSENEMEEDRKLFEKYKKILDKQYENWN